MAHGVKNLPFWAATLSIIFAVQARANEDAIAVSPFPLSIVGDMETTAKSEATTSMSELSFAVADYSSPQDLQRLGRQVTWFALLTIAGCLLVVAYANKRNRNQRRIKGEMYVVETLPLGPRCFCDLLNVRGQYFVVARDSTGLKDLHQVNSFGDALSTATTGQSFDEDTEFERSSTSFGQAE